MMHLRKSLLYIALIAFPVCFSLSASAQSFVEKKVSKAADIIKDVVIAYGGKEAIKSLNTVRIEHETRGYSVGQSRKPEKPWDVYKSRGLDAINIEDAVFISKNSGASGGFEFSGANIINGDASYQIDYRAGTAQKVIEADFNTRSGPFIRVTPALLVAQLMNRSHTAYYLGDVKHKTRKHYVLGFSMEVGPALALYIDQKTHLISHSERVLPGAGLVAYEFRDYESLNGIPFNKKFELWVDGDLDMERTIVSTHVNESVESLTIVESDLTLSDPLPPTPLSHQELAPGVHLIGGNGTYALFVEMRDYLVAVGGTGGSEQRIEKLREIVPDKPIRFGVLTHHHFDHVMAVPNYLENDATIVTAKAHEQVVREAAGGSDIKLETVDDKKLLSDGTQKLALINIGPTAHTDSLLVAWLPDHGILFEADHFSVPVAGPIAPAVSSTRSFAKVLEKEKLQPKLIVSAHSPKPATMKDLQYALNKKVYKE